MKLLALVNLIFINSVCSLPLIGEKLVLVKKPESPALGPNVVRRAIGDDPANEMLILFKNNTFSVLSASQSVVSQGSFEFVSTNGLSLVWSDKLVFTSGVRPSDVSNGTFVITSNTDKTEIQGSFIVTASSVTGQSVDGKFVLHPAASRDQIMPMQIPPPVSSKPAVKFIDAPQESDAGSSAPSERNRAIANSQIRFVDAPVEPMVQKGDGVAAEVDPAEEVTPVARPTRSSRPTPAPNGRIRQQPSISSSQQGAVSDKQSEEVDQPRVQAQPAPLPLAQPAELPAQPAALPAQQAPVPLAQQAPVPLAQQAPLPLAQPVAPVAAPVVAAPVPTLAPAQAPPERQRLDASLSSNNFMGELVLALIKNLGNNNTPPPTPTVSEKQVIAPAPPAMPTIIINVAPPAAPREEPVRKNDPPPPPPPPPPSVSVSVVTVHVTEAARPRPQLCMTRKGINMCF